ncbi:MAG: hypothetical protein QW099_07605 [Candidatus Bathyarchaeia archaeon]
MIVEWFIGKNYYRESILLTGSYVKRLIAMTPIPSFSPLKISRSIGENLLNQ